MFRVPSVKTIRRTFDTLDHGAATKIYRLMRGDLDPETIDGVRATYDPDARTSIRIDEQVMEAINILAKGSGVEAVESNSIWIDNFHGNIVASYVNTGDTYSGTILLDHRSGNFYCTTWGDFVERNEKLFSVG